MQQAAEAVQLDMERGRHMIFVAAQPPLDEGLLAPAEEADVPLPQRKE
jgi:hypothetical protein